MLILHFSVRVSQLKNEYPALDEREASFPVEKMNQPAMAFQAVPLNARVS